MRRARRSIRAKGCTSPQSMRCIGQEQRNQTNINDLPHCLLQEILQKANHQPEWLPRCRLVCKLWRSIVPPRYDPPFALIFNLQSPGPGGLMFPLYVSESSIFSELDGFDLSYVLNVRGLVYVLASCVDLLLCTDFMGSQDQFYVVNPWTKNWTTFPGIQTCFCVLRQKFPVGLVTKTSPDVSAGHRYRLKVVIVTHINSYTFEAQVFDPDLNVWNHVCVLHPYGLSCWEPAGEQALAYNGALHWRVKNGPIVAYDPFASPNGGGSLQCCFIARSHAMKHNIGDTDTSTAECLTVSEGYICMIHITKFHDHENEALLSLRVWKLKDYEGGEWELYHRVYFKDMVSQLPYLQHCIREFATRHDETEMYPVPLACHPKKAHVVYMHFSGNKVSCNLLTKTLKLVSSKGRTPSDFSACGSIVPFSASFPPTPLPKLLQQ